MQGGKLKEGRKESQEYSIGKLSHWEGRRGEKQSRGQK